ncbi:hypothetical protein RRG08_060125, partial [Elysia crispata]
LADLSGPLKEMTDISYCIVVIVRTTPKDKSGIKAGSGTGVKRAPDTCKDVPDSEWSGCYFELIDLEVADVFVINTDSSSSFPFGAYLYTTSAIRQDTICSQLGMPKILPSQLEYDFNEYISQQNTCVEETATSEPPSSLSSPTTYNTSENGSATAADINQETTTLSPGFTLTTGATNLGLHVTTHQQDSASSANTDADMTTSPAGSMQPDTSTASNGNVDSTPSGSTQSATSTASNDNVDNTPSGPPQSATSTASNGNVDNMPSGPPQSATSTVSNGNVNSTLQRCREIRTPLSNTTLTLKEMEETVEKIITHLRVNTEELSSVKRSKISAPDDRVSSTTMGMGGIVFIVVVTGLMIVSDIGKLVHDLRFALGVTNKSKI